MTPPASAATPTAIAGRHERHDDEVDDRRQDREPSERHEDDRAGSPPARRARRRGSRRATPGHGPPPRRPIHSVSGVAQAMSPAVASDDSWKPASPISAGSRHQQQRRRPAERRGRASGAARLAREQHDTGHERGPHHRRRRARERDVGDDREDRHDRPSAAAEPPGHRGDRRRDDGDVPARDRDDVADARRRERGREVAVDPVAEADQDPGRESGLGFGEDTGQRVACAAPECLEPTAGIVRARSARSASATSERPDRPDPREVLAVRRIGPRPDRPVHDRRGRRGRPPGSAAASPRRGTTRGAGLGRRASRPAGRRAATRSTRPPSSTARPRPGGSSTSRCPARHQRQPDGDECGPERDRDQRSRHEAPGRASWRSRIAARAERDRRAQVARGDLSGCDRGRDRPDREPAAPAHLADRHEILEVGERLLADELPRPEVLDGSRTAVRRATRGSWRPSPGRSRAACRAPRPWPGSGRSAPTGHAGPPAPAPPPVVDGSVAAASSRDGHADLVAVVERSGEVELAAGSVRVDTRSIATGRSDQVADPRIGRQARKTPGWSTAPTISTTRSAARDRPARTRPARDGPLGPTRRAAPIRRRRRPTRPSSSRPRARTHRSPARPPRRRRRASTAGSPISSRSVRDCPARLRARRLDRILEDAPRRRVRIHASTSPAGWSGDDAGE